jgi:hypothetical protein
MTAMRGVLVLIALGIAALPASARQDVCRPAASETVVATHDARVFFYRDRYVACSYRFQRRVRLGDDVNAPYIVNRRYVLHGLKDCDGSGCVYDIVERDLKTGRLRFDFLNGPTSMCAIDGDCGVPVALQVQLRGDGSAAWIACNGTVEEPPYESECNGRRYVQIIDGRGLRFADRGKIPPHSLRFNKTHRQVLWTNAGKPRSARLYFSAAGHTIR